MNLPFKMRTETPMEKYRHDSFFQKEPETLEWIRSFDPHDVFFDVGANVGVYSLYAASLFSDMLIVAFEPMPKNFLSLYGNREMNGFNNIRACGVAIGSFTGEVHLFIPEDEAGRSGAQVAEVLKGNSVLTPIIEIDFINEKLWTPTHVKIDIDGQELEVVRGMQRTLPHVKSCLIEVSRTSRGPIMEIMTAAGFGTDNRFNTMTPHSRERRAAEGIDAENIVFMR